MKILILGNEFIEEDSSAKKLAYLFSKKFVEIKDSFELISELEKNKDERVILVDVVEGLKSVKKLKLEDLKDSKILTAHDFDASFILKLLKPNVEIIGIPKNIDKENLEELKKEAEKLIKAI